VDYVEISANRVNTLFGERLSSVRRLKRISQSTLGEQVGLSRTTIANLERGTQNVQLHQIYTLAKALDVKPELLIPKQHEISGEEDTVKSLYDLVTAKIANLGDRS
jgi:transcriptional regulator with XRE-family HTH domain